MESSFVAREGERKEGSSFYKVYDKAKGEFIEDLGEFSNTYEAGYYVWSKHLYWRFVKGENASDKAKRVLENKPRLLSELPAGTYPLIEVKGYRLPPSLEDQLEDPDQILSITDEDEVEAIMLPVFM